VSAFLPYAVFITRGIYPTGSPGLPAAGTMEAEAAAAAAAAAGATKSSDSDKVDDADCIKVQQLRGVGRFIWRGLVLLTLY
jgi:hypothetical protein